MRKTLFVLLIFLGMGAIYCSKSKKASDVEANQKSLTIEAASRITGESIPITFTGTMVSKVYSDKDLLLMFNTVNSSDSYDRSILLTSENRIQNLQFRENDLVRCMIPENRRYIILQNLTTGQIALVGLSDSKIAEVKNSFRSAKNKIVETDFTGFGLSYMTGLWSMEKFKTSPYGNVFNTLMHCDVIKGDEQNKALLMLPPDDGGGTGGLCDQGKCTSGGAGSSSCSITEAPFNQSCSVTCNSGYYACCDSKTVRCYCCRIS